MNNDKCYATKGSGGQGMIITEGNGRTVAVVYEEKDTALFAAAPALLAALVDMETDMIEAMRRHGGLVGSVRPNTLGNATQAIAQARGEG